MTMISFTIPNITYSKTRYEGFIDGQLYWLNKWQEAILGFTEELEEKIGRETEYD